MKLSEFKNRLSSIENFNIQLSNGTMIPNHFHITEMGLQTKNFIDCGNTIREEKVITFQIWFANDLEHKLSPDKVYKIINASEKLFGEQDLELEVEYQTELTIGKFGIDFENGNFILTPKETACLANDHCGIPAEKMKVSLNDLQSKTSCCSAESNCC